ncbi:MAG: hypothetical protein JXQ73_04895 [Phycisphaerae bacterium]|nr:hypothetical protein [Phycisphaerae bacterium]
MKTCSAIGFCLVTVSAAMSAAELDLKDATIIHGPNAPQLERFAALELGRYLSQLAGKAVPVQCRDRLAGDVVIAVGEVAGVTGDKGNVPDDLGNQGFIIRVVDGALVLRGGSPAGTLYAVYDLLEHLGMGFYLGGDAYPDTPASLKVPADWDVRRKPVFEIRGSLPWYNFLNSPTTWNREDFKAFFDQMSKMRMNFVGFHTYDYEPFGAYRDETGKLVMGQPLKTTLNYNWGMTGPLKTADFGWGTGRFFDRDVFGSHATTDAKDDEDAILRAERDLREGLAYARMRGIHVCVGFEMTGDPHDRANQQRFRRHLADLLSDYPMIDYVWMWQTEGLGGGSGMAGHGTLARARMEQLRETFSYLKEEKRIAEASRMTDFILLAHRILGQLAPDKRMIVSGWGGDRWMRFSDFYLGLDRVLPKDIIFAALDNIDPTAEGNVSKVYGQVSADRERWPIPWFESDGGGTRRDQWGPQPNVKPFTALCRDAREKGCQGILGIHWRTRAVEEVAAFTAQYAWEPSLTYEGFYDRFAERSYGKRHGKELSSVHRELESMGSRWSGMLGQVECGGFSWTSDGKKPDHRKLARLDEIAKRLEEIRVEMFGKQAVPSSRSRASVSMTQVERLEYLLTTIRWLSRYDRAVERFLPGGPVETALIEATREREEGRQREAVEAALRAWELVRTSGFGEAIRTYAGKLTNQGEFGVLATINVKAVVTYRRLVDRIAGFLPVGPPLEPTYTYTRQGTLLRWRPAARAVRYRVTAGTTGGQGQQTWETGECSMQVDRRLEGWVFVRGLAGDGVEGPPSETLVIPDPVLRNTTRSAKVKSPPVAASARPSTTFAPGEAIPVRVAVVGESQPVGVELHSRFNHEEVSRLLQSEPTAMEIEFGCTYRGQIGIPHCLGLDGPGWVEYVGVASPNDDADAAVLVGPTGGRWSATIERRPFARTWRPVADSPPIAGKDWPVVIRVMVDGPEDGVAVRLVPEGGQEIEAKRVPHGSFQAVVPGKAIRDPELRLGVVITRTNSGREETFRSQTWAFRTDSLAPDAPSGVAVNSPRRYQAVLEWADAEDDTGVVAYRIERNGKPVAETARTTWLDARVAAGERVQYRITAIDGAGRTGKPAEIEWQAPAWPLPKPPTGLKAGGGFGLITLEWTAPEDDVAFRVLRAEATNGPYAVISGKDAISDREYVDYPPRPGQEYWYQVIAADPLDRRSGPCESVSARAKPVPTEPILVADFETPETSGKLQGGARIGKGKRGKGLDLSNGGWADFTDRKEYDGLLSFSLTLWIRADSLDEMPVIVSHGEWGGPGIFLQFLSQRVRTYIGSGRVTDGGSPSAGTWHHIAVVRRGDLLTTLLDGKPIAHQRVGTGPVGEIRTPLRIGQYTQVQPVYQVKGVIDEVRLYLRPLSEEEVRQDMNRP